MKNKELFERTVNVLTTAYKEGTLQSMNCHACAVGNMIAAAQGFSIITHNNGGLSRRWEPGAVGEYFAADWLRTLSINDGLMTEDAIINATNWLLSTGYTFDELRIIESAFEGGAGIDRRKSDDLFVTETYHGLVAVYDALLKIHKVDPLSVLKAEEVFVKESVTCTEQKVVEVV